MRPDVKVLLTKLGQRDFQYREFADPIADVEPWPLFAALLGDARVVGRTERPGAEPRFVRSSDFFADYQKPSIPAGPVDRQDGSLRTFLSGLSDKSGIRS